MSLQSFQSALAYVIRSFDSENTKDLSTLARRYELSSDEKFTLDNLINQQRLKAYSEELFLARWTIIRDALKFLEPIVDLEAMSRLWEQEFEPKSATICHEELALRFVEYLAFDKTGTRFISAGTPPYLASIMRYLHAVFTFRHNYLPKHSILPDSALTDRYFSVIKLDYDVREFFAQLVELDDSNNKQLDPPEKRDLTLLFVASEEVTEFRSFEIDHELSSFLEAQLKGEKDQNASVPCYEDLVDLGLCKPRGIKRSCCTSC